MGLLIAVLFISTSVVFNQALAQFYRTQSPTSGFSYGYGYNFSDGTYGYGYGYYQESQNYGFFGSDGKATSVSTTVNDDTKATVSYTTGYFAQNRIQCGLTSSLGSNTSFTSLQTGANSIQATGLSCNTLYYYRVNSRDSGSNDWFTSNGTFTTAACPSGGSAVPSSPAPSPAPAPAPTPAPTPVAPTQPQPVSVSQTVSTTGGTVSVTTNLGTVAQVTLPAAAVSTNTTVTISTVSATQAPVVGMVLVAGQVYQISAVGASGNAVTSFDQAVTLTFTYTDAQVSGVSESTIAVHRWNGVAWVALPSIVNVAANTVTATTTNFSEFALMARAGGELTALQAQLDALITQLRALLVKAQAQGVTLPAGAEKYLASSAEFTRDLTIGSKGDDVKALQQFLNGQGFKVTSSGVGSPGNESTYFGSLTKAALAKYQAANGISPASGYFGSITRARVGKRLPLLLLVRKVFSCAILRWVPREMM